LKTITITKIRRKQQRIVANENRNKVKWIWTKDLKKEEFCVRRTNLLLASDLFSKLRSLFSNSVHLNELNLNLLQSEEFFSYTNITDSRKMSISKLNLFIHWDLDPYSLSLFVSKMFDFIW